MEENIEATEKLLKSCLQQQINELDMLQSIYCNAGELKIDDYSVLADINEFLEAKRPHLNRNLDYTITLKTGKGANKIDIFFELPHLYPLIETPSLCIRITLDSHQKSTIESAIKRAANEFIVDIDKSTVYVYQIVTWIEENWERIVRLYDDANETKTTEIEAKKSVEMERLWIYSHHLKSTTKRQDIMKLASELDLSGFSKPGKPGIICVEGQKEHTQTFWKCIRQWAWQRITVRITESKSRSEQTMNTFRRFNGFNEMIYAHNDANDENSIQKMDISAFMKYLDQHQCQYVKKDLFHLD